MLIDGLTGDARPARVRALLRLADTCARSGEGEAEMWVRATATRELSALADEYPEQYRASFTMGLARLKIAAATSESGDLDLALAISETEVEERRAMFEASPGEGQYLARGLITHALLLFDDRQDTLAVALLAEALALWPEWLGRATGGRPWELEVLEPAIVRQAQRIGEYDPALARRLFDVGVGFGLAEVELALGRVLVKNGEADEAISLLGRREHDGEVAVEELLGAAYYLIGDTDHGITLWHAALAAGSATAACNLAWRALDDGALADAEKWLGQAFAADPQLLISLDGQNAQWLTTNVGLQLLQAGGAVDRAMVLLRRAADVGFAPAQHLLGIALMDRGDEETPVWLERAATQGNPAAADNLGTWCFLAGDRAEARRWWLQAHEEGVRAATYHLGVLYLTEGALGAARALLEPARDAGMAAAGVALAVLDHVSGRAIDGASGLQTMAAADGNVAEGARLVLALLGDQPAQVEKLADEALAGTLVRFVP